MSRKGRRYSVSPDDYKLLQEVGFGASATVYRAMYIPYNEVVAVKCLDLDRCGSNLDDIRREAQTMSLIDHPSIIRAYCSFVVDHCLWVVMPFMAEGSCLHLMKIAYPDGFEEHIICSILMETLKALEYLHKQGHIHRDIKAGNILLDSSGAVKLGDFGVTACMFDNGDRKRARNTFVGTPCWMAPEVLQPGSGYDFKADIWSFGITALELAHGHAPFSKYPPMKVLLMTLQNAPPGLDYDRDKRFSKAFKEMVAMCLVKDQTKRPTTEKLLKHSFFKQAKSPEFTVKHLLVDLPPLWDSVKALQLKDAAQLALKKMPSTEQEALSQSEYQRGVSAWNFDVEDLKAQASLILEDDENFPETKVDNGNMRFFANIKSPSTPRGIMKRPVVIDGIDSRKNMGSAEGLNDENQETNSTSSHIQERVDRGNMKYDMLPSTSKPDVGSGQRKNQVGTKHQTYSGPLVISSMERGRTSERFDGDNQLPSDKHKRNAQKNPNYSGPLMLQTRASGNSLSVPTHPSGGYGDSEDKSKLNVVQIKGRFSVTSENKDLVKDMPIGTDPRKSSQAPPLRKSASVGDCLVQPNISKQMPISLYPKEMINSSVPASLLMPHLQNLFQQTSFQQDLIVSLLNSVQQNDQVHALLTELPPQANNLDSELVETAATERERLLLMRISELQARMINLTSELTAVKQKHIQLQQQLNGAYCREDGTEEIEDT